MLKMNIQKFENKCRICWGENVELNWNNVLPHHTHLTYRDCYYKYTHLEYIAESSLSTMLCCKCSKSLEYIDAFISKAIENDAKLKEMIFDCVTIKTEDNPNLASNSEVICVEEIEIKQEVQNPALNEIAPEENESLFILEKCVSPLKEEPTEQIIMAPDNTKEVEEHKLNNDSLLVNKKNFYAFSLESNDGTGNSKNYSKTLSISENLIAEPSLDTPTFIALLRQLRKYHGELTDSSCRRTKKNEMKNKKMNEIRKENQKPQLISNQKSSTKSILSAVKPETNKSPESTQQRLLCQYCALEIKSLSNLRLHEASHNVNRERTETCPKCGVKFYNKKALGIHIKTHDANRPKEFKCEFCEKAFFNRGALNIHRRIHLGLMVKCQICSKEFFRNVELYKHMNSHSSTLINVEVKKRSRYFVRCKHCGKKILSTSFKSHTAAHLKEPLVKCSICNKDFFRRKSCRYHLTKIHNKKPEELTDFMILYERMRYTHLYIKQNADLEQKED